MAIIGNTCMNSAKYRRYSSEKDCFPESAIWKNIKERGDARLDGVATASTCVSRTVQLDVIESPTRTNLHALHP
jgi:hypothetical protein